MNRRVVDLTYPIHEGMTTYPVHWHPVVEITVLGRHGIENRETRKLVLGTHTGTHCDAPRHFVPGGKTIDQISPDVFVGPATLLDFSVVGPKQEVNVSDLEKQLGSERPERLILRFDWSDHWGRLSYYSDHPYLSQAAARWLVERGVRLLAMDTPMPDDPRNGRGAPLDSPNHTILLGAEVILVEYLCNLRSLKTREIELIVAPLNIRDGDGAPLRCFAIERD
jgi:arylformamidase